MQDTTPIKSQLVALLGRLEERAQRIDAHQHNEGREVPKDWPEQAKFRDGDEVVDALEGMTDHEIAEVRAAIRRIDEGVWHKCVKCHKTISDARHAAKPYAVFCINCAERPTP